ncbi:MAG: YaiI/YqxD family protein [Paracoccaceae bacterium]
MEKFATQRVFRQAPVLYIDGDACPVKAEAMTAAARHGITVRIVSNGGLRPSAFPGAEMVYVPDGPDAADKWIAAEAGAGDVVVTGDIPLAARAVEKGAVVVKQDGAVLTAANIGMALASRDLMADLRAADPFRPGGGRPFGRADRARFAAAIDRVLARAKRQPPPDAAMSPPGQT